MGLAALLVTVLAIVFAFSLSGNYAVIQATQDRQGTEAASNITATSNAQASMLTNVAATSQQQYTQSALETQAYLTDLTVMANETNAVLTQAADTILFGLTMTAQNQALGATATVFSNEQTATATAGTATQAQVYVVQTATATAATFVAQQTSVAATATQTAVFQAQTRSANATDAALEAATNTAVVQQTIGAMTQQAFQATQTQVSVNATATIDVRFDRFVERAATEARTASFSPTVVNSIGANPSESTQLVGVWATINGNERELVWNGVPISDLELTPLIIRISPDGQYAAYVIYDSSGDGGWQIILQPLPAPLSAPSPDVQTEASQIVSMSASRSRSCLVG
ncbi:MAG: hypothetical protein IPO91_28915 [Chloroflexi bacterium]|nr:hypothetical protein [Chloroflexota bacterium]